MDHQLCAYVPPGRCLDRSVKRLCPTLCDPEPSWCAEIRADVPGFCSLSTELTSRCATTCAPAIAVSPAAEATSWPVPVLRPSAAATSSSAAATPSSADATSSPEAATSSSAAATPSSAAVIGPLKEESIWLAVSNSNFCNETKLTDFSVVDGEATDCSNFKCNTNFDSSTHSYVIPSQKEYALPKGMTLAGTKVGLFGGGKAKYGCMLQHKENENEEPVDFLWTKYTDVAARKAYICKGGTWKKTGSVDDQNDHYKCLTHITDA